MPGISEVLHAEFAGHAYPVHTHDSWTVLLVDAGAVRYDLDGRQQHAIGQQVTVLPPGVPHDGRSASTRPFRKRVAYLDAELLDARLVGAAVDRPGVQNPALLAETDALHRALAHPGDTFAAEARLCLVVDRLRSHLTGRPEATARDRPLAHRLRVLLDDHLVDGINLATAATRLGASPTHVVRAFSAEYGIAPHRYLTGRRLDRARRLLLAGHPAAQVAVDVGFHDQAHLSRHFRRLLGVPPGAYARSAAT